MPEDIEITQLDHLIFQNEGTTVNIERLPSQLQAAKSSSPLTYEKLLEENGRLREEVAYHQSALKSFMILFEKSRDAVRILETALRETSYRGGPHRASTFLFQRAHQGFMVLKMGLRDMSEKMTASEQRLLDYFGITLDDTRSKDLEII